MLIDHYVSYIQDDIFPNGLAALGQCHNADEI
jgi:hypothetical protein